MKIAYVLFNNITLLDFIGVYDAVLRLKTMNYIPELRWDLCALQHDQHFIEWLQTASPEAWKTSVCTGSLLLGAAGFLKNKKATTHFDNYEILKQYCKEVVTGRVVEDGNVITAGAVSSSIDLGLYLCHKWTGAEAAAAIRRRMDYRG